MACLTRISPLVLVCELLLATAVSSPALAHDGDFHRAAPPAASTASEPARDVAATRSVMPAALARALAHLRRPTIPSFSRQTGLPCSACHYQFPQLTAFGRLFKLNGYTMTGLQTIGQPGDSAGHESLKLSPIPGISAMAVASLSHTSRTPAGTQNGTTQLPQQFSLFAAGEITPNVGIFTQFTYEAQGGSFGVDNIDLRYATHHSLGARDFLLGLTLHNNPTVQDVWNTVPAWSFPFMSSGVAPSPIASTLIDGALGQQVVGLGAYSLIGNTVYGELTAYRSAPQGGTQPLDSSVTNAVKGVIPYWRFALQRATPASAMMIGTWGFDAHLYPAGVTGPTDQYVDAAVDAQVEQKVGKAMWIGRAAYIHETQHLDASASGSAPTAERVNENLATLRASIAFQPSVRYGLTAGYFQTTGTTDATRFAEGDLTGSRTGSPNTSGAIGEFDYNAWQNLRIGVQWVGYNRFNGSGTAYDVAGGRRAADNNTLYAHLWLAF